MFERISLWFMNCMAMYKICTCRMYIILTIYSMIDMFDQAALTIKLFELKELHHPHKD